MLQLINESVKTKLLVCDYKSSPQVILSCFTTEKQLKTMTWVFKEMTEPNDSMQFCGKEKENANTRN